MIDLSNVIALALGSDDVLQIQDAIGTVLWQKIIYYNVNISAGSNGTVSVNGVSGDYSQSVPSGTVLTIEGTGNTGYDFDGWSDGNTTNPRTITVTGDLTLTAVFESALLNYFYIENTGIQKTLKIRKNDANAPTIEVFKSTDRTNWTLIGSTNTTYITATIPIDSKLYLKATTNTWGSSASYYNNILVDGNGSYSIGGNIMSLLYGDNFEGQTSFPNNDTYIFTHLFDGDTNLFNTSNLILPATTMTQGCYLGMFKGCTSLITAPALPATTLAQVCYSTMFQNCSSLKKVTTYADDISATYCTYNWLDSVSATGDFYNLGGATYTSGASGIPTGWTEHRPNYLYVEDISGSDNTLSITNTNNDVYYSTDKSNWTLFNGTATIPANGRLYLKSVINTWDGRNISASGNHNVGGNIMSLLYGDNFEGKTTFPNGSDSNFYGLFVGNTYLISVANLIFPATTLTDRCYNYMFGYCTSLTTAPTILPATTLTGNCYEEMFSGCSSLTTAPALPATTLAIGCYRSMFMGCTSLVEAPTLPAPTLEEQCYMGMFDSCTNLNKMRVYASDISAMECTDFWLFGVAATGDFYNLGGLTYPSGASGIPTGWTEHTSL